MVVVAEVQEYSVYAYRWHILLIFGFVSMMNAIVWISFASILPDTRNFYGVSTLEVDFLSMIYMVLYLPGSLLASYMINKWGLSRSVIVASAMTALGGWIKYAGCFLGSKSLAYVAVVVGQFLGGMAQPIFTSSPAKLAAEWFSTGERDIATVISSLFNPIGNAIGQAIPPLLIGQGMSTLLLAEAGLASVVGLWALLCFRTAPVSPPSRTAAEALARREARQGVPRSAVREVMGEYSALLANRYIRGGGGEWLRRAVAEFPP